MYIGYATSISADATVHDVQSAAETAMVQSDVLLPLRTSNTASPTPSSASFALA